MHGQFGRIAIDGVNYPIDKRIFVFGGSKHCDIVLPNDGTTKPHEAKIIVDKDSKIWLSRFGEENDIHLIDKCTFTIRSCKFTFSAPRSSKKPAKQSAADIFSGATPSNILWDETEVAEYEEAESYEGPDTVDVKKSLDFDTTTVLGFNLLDEGTLGLGLPSPSTSHSHSRNKWKQPTNIFAEPSLTARPTLRATASPQSVAKQGCFAQRRPFANLTNQAVPAPAHGGIVKKRVAPSTGTFAISKTAGPPMNSNLPSMSKAKGSVQPDQSGPVNAQRNVPAAVQPDLAKTNSLGLGKADPRRFGRLQPKLQPDPPERKPAVDPRCPVGPHVDPQGKSDSSQTDMPATGQPDPLHRVSPVTNLQAARNAVKQTRQPWLQDLQEKLSAMQAVASRLPRPKDKVVGRQRSDGGSAADCLAQSSGCVALDAADVQQSKKAAISVAQSEARCNSAGPAMVQAHDASENAHGNSMHHKQNAPEGPQAAQGGTTSQELKASFQDSASSTVSSTVGSQQLKDCQPLHARPVNSKVNSWRVPPPPPPRRTSHQANSEEKAQNPHVNDEGTQRPHPRSKRPRNTQKNGIPQEERPAKRQCKEQTAPAGAADVCEVAIHQQKAAQENSKVELAASGGDVPCVQASDTTADAAKSRVLRRRRLAPVTADGSERRSNAMALPCRRDSRPTGHISDDSATLELVRTKKLQSLTCARLASICAQLGLQMPAKRRKIDMVNSISSCFN
uniref:FHA domain-containing protein n=1 Tax=Eutreptiella gymnastica TaxID=73025 RepID=A0A7S4LJP2_9EUGL